MGYEYRESCRELVKVLKISPLSSQYIFSLLLFVGNNRVYFVSNSLYHNNNTRQINDFHLPRPCIRKEFIRQASKSLTVFPRQLRVYPAGLKSLKLL